MKKINKSKIKTKLKKVVKILKKITSKEFIKKFYLDTIEEIKFLLNKKTNDEAKNIAIAPTRIGLWLVIIFVGIGGIWSMSAPINSAAVVVGKIIPSSNKKTIQHLEGGIIEEILISEGDVVEEGQVLIKLQDTRAKSNLELLKKQITSYQATKTRLEAERDYEKKVIYDKDFFKDIDCDSECQKASNTLKITEGEKKLFKTRRNSLEGKIKLLRQRIKQYKKEIDGVESQKLATLERMALVVKEYDVVKELYDKGITPQTRVLNLEQQIAQLKGNDGEYESIIAKARQSITASEMEIVNGKNEYLNGVIGSLQEIQTKVADLEERIIDSTDVLERILIRAPKTGTINKLAYHTEGGVIPAGQPIMELIPQDDELIAEVMVAPRDIDVVRVGLDASVILQAYKTKKASKLKGKVIYVAPDSTVDSNAGMSYFVAKIRVNEGELEKLKGVKLYAGMQVSGMIITGSRTLFRYMANPIGGNISKAFRED